MSLFEMTVVGGVGAGFVLLYRSFVVKDMKKDLAHLEVLERHVARNYYPQPTMAERQALADELQTQREALRLWWPRRDQRILWETLPCDVDFMRNRT
jgi:hypothetical protein